MIHLVCGGNGFIGRHLTTFLRQSHPRDTVVTLDRRPKENGDDSHVSCDLTDGEAVKAVVAKVRPDCLYHVAGSARVSDLFGVDDYFRGNFLSTVSLLSACERLDKPVKFFLSSSVHVYGNRDEMVDETTPLSPTSLYAFSKYLAEEAVRQAVQRTSHLRGVVGRLYTCIGPGQGPGFVAADFCRRLAALPSGPGTRLETGPLSPFRRFSDVRDAVQAFGTLMENQNADRFSIYNIASPHEASVRSILLELIALSKKRPLVVEAVAGENAFSGLRLSTQKLEGVFPASRFRPLKDTLREMYEWQVAHP